MKLSNELRQYVDARFSQYEKKKGIKVLCWWLRGTINMGMYRRNSDLDIAFLFSDKSKRCKGIHDLYGHGLDLWGIEINEIIQTIRINNESYYKGKNHKLMVLSQAHARAGCNYYFGVYSAVGNEWVMNRTSFLTDLQENFIKAGEPVLMAKQLLGFVETRIEDILFFDRLYLYDYLMSIWRLLLADKILKGGMPGDNHIIKLCQDSMCNNLYNDILFRLKQYRESKGKKSDYIQEDLFNAFIVEKYDQVCKLLNVSEPKYKDSYEKELNEIESYFSGYRIGEV